MKLWERIVIAALVVAFAASLLMAYLKMVDAGLMPDLQ